MNCLKTVRGFSHLCCYPGMPTTRPWAEWSYTSHIFSGFFVSVSDRIHLFHPSIALLPPPSPRPICWYPWRTLIVYRLAVCFTTVPALVYFIILIWTMISSTRDCSLIQKARVASLSVTAIIIHFIFSSTYLFVFQLFCKAKSCRSACHHRQCTYVCFL